MAAGISTAKLTGFTLAKLPRISRLSGLGSDEGAPNLLRLDGSAPTRQNRLSGRLNPW
jgi:hypothetical protein